MCVRLELELERDKRERDARERELRERELREMELREKMKADMDLKPPGMPASKPGTVSSSVCVRPSICPSHCPCFMPGNVILQSDSKTNQCHSNRMIIEQSSPAVMQ